jgi:hypothetical protein
MIRLYHFPGNNDAILPGALFRVPGKKRAAHRRLQRGLVGFPLFTVTQKLLAAIKTPEHSVRLGGSTQYVRGGFF